MTLTPHATTEPEADDGAIDSQDPEAIAKLQARCAKLEAWQQHMVAANKLVRKDDHAGLVALGLTEAAISRLFNPTHGQRKGYKAWQLRNNKANINRLTARIAEITAQQATIATFVPITGTGWQITVAEDRVCIAFAERPPQEQTQQLRRHGFLWSPNRGAWVRKFSSDALHWAKQIVGAPAEPAPTGSTSDAPTSAT